VIACAQLSELHNVPRIGLQLTPFNALDDITALARHARPTFSASRTIRPLRNSISVRRSHKLFIIFTQ
jgi:hypothetical protein